MENNTIPHPKKRAMLAALAKSGNVTVAAKAAKIDRSTHYGWLADDPDYAKSADAAMEDAADLLEQEARRRAETGVEESVYGRVGKDLDGEIGTVRKYSDTLLIFLLKGARPDKYRERSEVKHTGGVALKGVDLAALSSNELATLESLAEKVAVRPGGDADSGSR